MPLGAFKAGMFGAAGGGGGNGWAAVFGLTDASSADFYPYNFELLNNGTTGRVGGRWNDSGSNADARICYIDLDLSGGLSSPPDSATGQTAWSFSITQVAQEGIYAEQAGGGLWVDSDDNSYEVGNVWGTSTYEYYNLGVNKYNSSGTQQWQEVFRQNTGTFSAGMQRAVVWHDETNNDCVFLTVFQDSLAGWNKRRHQMVLLNDSTGTVRSTSWNRMIYMNNENSSANNQMGFYIRRSNVNGSKIATMHSYYDNSDKYLVSPILWDMGQPYGATSGWTTTSVGLRNMSTGSTDIYGSGGVQLDSSDNVYCSGVFGATNVDGSGSNQNVFISKHNSSGTLQWIYCFRQQAGGTEESLNAGGLVIDGTDLYVSGYSYAPGGSTYHPFIAKVDVSGTPSLDWITQIQTSYSCYSSTLQIVGDQIISSGYGQTSGPSPGSGTPVVGFMASLNKDGSSLGTATVDGETVTAIDLSSYIVFADANSSGTTANVWVINNGSVSITEGAINNTTGGYYNTKVSGAPSTTNTVEGGAIS